MAGFDEARQAAVKAEREIREPMPAFRFEVEIQGVPAGWFTDCTGLTVERQVKKYEEGGVNAYVHQLPDRIKHTNVVLKRGLADPLLWAWFEGPFGLSMFQGSVMHANVTILLYGTNQHPSRLWHLYRAFPVKWSGPELRTDGNQVAVETIEIAHHGITLVPVGR